MNKLFTFDTSYSLETIKHLKMEVFYQGKLLEGFFKSVTTANAVSTILLDDDNAKKFGGPKAVKITNNIEYIEGKVGISKKLKYFKTLNFLMSLIYFTYHCFLYIRKEKINFLRAEDPHLNGIICIFLSKILNIPSVIGVWGNPDEIREDICRPIWANVFKFIFIEKQIEKIVLRSASKVIVQNTNNKDFVIRKGVDPSNIGLFRISNQINDIYFSEPIQRDIRENFFHDISIKSTKTMLCISRLEKLKRVQDVIQLCYNLKQENLFADVLICGEGPYKNELIALSKELGIERSIFFLGNVDQVWLANAICNVSLVVSPLTGRALGEAALSGAPVLAYDRDWQSEIIQDGITGSLCAFNDIDSLTKKAKKLLKDPALSKKLGQNLRKFSLELLNKSSALSRELELYKQLQ